MFVKRGRDKVILFILVKIGDDQLFAGGDDIMRDFVWTIRRSFERSK